MGSGLSGGSADLANMLDGGQRTIMVPALSISGRFGLLDGAPVRMGTPGLHLHTARNRSVSDLAQRTALQPPRECKESTRCGSSG